MNRSTENGARADDRQSRVILVLPPSSSLLSSARSNTEAKEEEGAGSATLWPVSEVAAALGKAEVGGAMPPSP